MKEMAGGSFTLRTKQASFKVSDVPVLSASKHVRKTFPFSQLPVEDDIDLSDVDLDDWDKDEL